MQKKIKIVFSTRQGNGKSGPHCFLCAGPAKFSFLVEGNINTYFSCDKCHSHFAGNERFELEFLQTEEKLSA